MTAVSKYLRSILLFVLCGILVNECLRANLQGCDCDIESGEERSQIESNFVNPTCVGVAEEP